MNDILLTILVFCFIAFWIYAMLIKPFWVTFQNDKNLVKIRSGLKTREFDISKVDAIFFCRYLKAREIVKWKFSCTHLVPFIYGWGNYLSKDVIVIIVEHNAYFLDGGFAAKIALIDGVKINNGPP